MLVTPEGRWVVENSAEFLAALGDPNPDYDSTLFAVKNLGFIKFQIVDNSVIEIELHPQNVELPALLAVQQQLLSSQVKLFRIKYFEISWKSEIMVSSELAVSRLSELCSPAFAPPCSNRFIAEPCEYATLFSKPENPLGLMAQKWRMSFGSFDPTVISFAIKHQLLSRMMVVGVQPRYDIIRAAIQARPSQPGLFMTRYERLLLPWRTPSEEVFVTLSSKRLDDADLAEAEAEAADSPTSSISAKSA